jgi:hypothetical protein
MSQAQIKALQSRVIQLEDQLKAHQQQIVNTVAMQLQTFFTNPVMVDSLAHRLLIAGANAIAHKASHSTERAPELTVLEGYIPGALRAILNTDGSLSIEQQLKGATNAGGEWESATALYEEKGVLDSFAQLLSAFGAEAGRVYYITDTVTAQTHREKMAKELVAAGVTGAGDDAPETPADADAVEFKLILAHDVETTSTQLFPKGTLVDVIRGDETLVISVDEVQDEDVLSLLDGDVKVNWIVFSSEEAYLPPTLEDGPEPEADPVFAGEGGEEDLESGDPIADGSELPELPPAGDEPATLGAAPFSEHTSVRLITKPWSLVESGQVDLVSDELTQYVGPYTDFTVEVEAGEVVKEAHELQARDLLIISRNGQVLREVVVSVEVGEFTTTAEEASAEGVDTAEAAPQE